MTAEQRVEVEAAQRESRNVRHWKRYHAVLLRADGMPLTMAAQTLSCSADRVTTWTTAWRARGVAGLREGVHPGAARRFDATGAAALVALVQRDPHAAGDAATGWTVALLHTELTQCGWRAGPRTMRRTRHRRGWVWQRPRVVLGRPDPDDAPNKGRWQSQPARLEQRVGRGWFGDETTRREDPPLRAAWAQRGAPANGVISGRNGRRVVHGARTAATGEWVQLLRARRRQDDCLACVEALGQVRPEVSKLLLWDNAPPHQPTRVLEAAARAHSTIAWLPFRAPELTPCADLWRLLKAVVAANRCFPDLDTLARHAVAWLDALTTEARLLCSGLLGRKFQWLAT
jgi:transposase